VTDARPALVAVLFVLAALAAPARAAGTSRGQALYASNCVPCHGPTGQGDGPLDGASLGMVIDASVRPRSLQELALATQLPEGASLARGEALVDRGYLRITSMDLAPDGRPSPTFTATGKSFPQLAS